MDKYEYKIKADEIKALIAQGEYQQAAEIADSIDWRRVKSVMMLCTISDLYKINRRYEDSRDILLLAYDRHPGGRTIVYSLCELSIKIEDYVMAIEYYKEFVQIAPKDTGRYILQYKLYQAQDVSLEERIAVLEELKSKEYREKWAYELAYLYHRVGLATKCVEECDELILWFGEGKYVVKAMELKMLHQPLTPQQQEKYDSRFQPEQTGGYQEPGAEEQGIQGDDQDNAVWTETESEQSAAEEAAEAVQPADVLSAPTIRIPSEEIDIQVKTMDVGQYNTINLQKELAEGLREVLEEEQPRSEVETEVFFGATGEIGDGMQEEAIQEQPDMETEETSEFVSEELLGEEELSAVEEPPTETETEPLTEAEAELPLEEEPPAEAETELLTEVEAELPLEEEPPAEAETELLTEVEAELPLEEEPSAEVEAELPAEEETQQSVEEVSSTKPAEKTTQAAEPEDHTAAVVMEQLRMQNLGIEPPKEMASVLSMESDGQISLVVPESEKVEKQITGQMSIQDILAEWERMKKENEEKRKEDIHQRVLQQTGPLFTAFEESIRDGLLEQLEQGVEPEDIAVLAEAAAEAEQTADSQDPIGAEDEVEELTEIEGLTEETEEDFSEASEEDPAEEEIFDDGENPEEISEEEYIEEEAAEEDIEEAESFEEESATDETAEKAFAEEYAEEAAAEEELREEEYFEEELAEEASGEEVSEEEALSADEVEEEIKEDTIEELPEEETEESPAEREESEEEPQAPAVSRPKVQVRALTREEKELYGTFIQSKSSKEKLIAAIDSISMASYTGNVVITGDEGMDTLSLAKNMIREVQITDSNFSGKIAKISGSSLNQRDVAQTLDGLANGALIIQKASAMNKNTVDALYKKLQQEQYGLIVIMEDTRKAMNKFLGVYTKLAECFNARVDMEALSNDALVAFGKKYAKEMEYSIDELGVLALHTRITEMQTSDHAVTIMDVKEIMDEAIQHANRKSVGHFMDILLAKRYDEEDMIILRENDFI